MELSEHYITVRFHAELLKSGEVDMVTCDCIDLIDISIYRFPYIK